MKLTHYGIREWLGGGIIFLFLLAGSVLIAVFADPLAGISLAVIFALLWLALAALNILAAKPSRASKTIAARMI